jgi:hypothetical protein
MPQVKTISVFAILFAMLFTFSGCGEVNDETFDPDDGHPSGWLPSGHKAAVAAEDEGVEECAECHGADLSGGNAKVSCTKCHLGGAAKTHPADWYDGSGKLVVAGKHSAYVETNGTANCATQYCHGSSLTGSAGPSCTSCHLGGAATRTHPADWYDGSGKLIVIDKHNVYVGTNGNTSCANANCHGAAFQGVTGSGPACTSCHLESESQKHVTGDLHKSAKHKDGFADGGIYKTYPPSKCSNLSCHGANFEGVTGSGSNCFDCHDGLHVSGPKSGKKTNGCLGCHSEAGGAWGF